MAEKATVARPYARAAFEYAREHGALGAWSKLLGIGAAVASEPGIGALLGNPRVDAAELVELLAGVAASSGATVDTEARNFLSLLAQGGRIGYLPEIAAQFETLRAEIENTLDVEVTTAMSLSEAQKARLSEALAKRFGRTVRIEEKVDESLVGGAIIRAGDLVIDGSLQGRLVRLEQQISQP
jgi:F-type H+-transporting ATPase subunit delta